MHFFKDKRSTDKRYFVYNRNMEVEYTVFATHSVEVHLHLLINLDNTIVSQNVGDGCFDLRYNW